MPYQGFEIAWWALKLEEHSRAGASVHGGLVLRFISREDYCLIFSIFLSLEGHRDQRVD